MKSSDKDNVKNGKSNSSRSFASEQTPAATAAATPQAPKNGRYSPEARDNSEARKVAFANRRSRSLGDVLSPGAEGELPKPARSGLILSTPAAQGKSEAAVSTPRTLKGMLSFNIPFAPKKGKKTGQEGEDLSLAEGGVETPQTLKKERGGNLFSSKKDIVVEMPKEALSIYEVAARQVVEIFIEDILGTQKASKFPKEGRQTMVTQVAAVLERISDSDAASVDVNTNISVRTQLKKAQAQDPRNPIITKNKVNIPTLEKVLGRLSSAPKVEGIDTVLKEIETDIKANERKIYQFSLLELEKQAAIAEAHVSEKTGAKVSFDNQSYNLCRAIIGIIPASKGQKKLCKLMSVVLNETLTPKDVHTNSGALKRALIQKYPDATEDRAEKLTQDLVAANKMGVVFSQVFQDIQASYISLRNDPANVLKDKVDQVPSHELLAESAKLLGRSSDPVTQLNILGSFISNSTAIVKTMQKIRLEEKSSEWAKVFNGKIAKGMELLVSGAGFNDDKLTVKHDQAIVAARQAALDKSHSLEKSVEMDEKINNQYDRLCQRLKLLHTIGKEGVSTMDVIQKLEELNLTEKLIEKEQAEAKARVQPSPTQSQSPSPKPTDSQSDSSGSRSNSPVDRAPTPDDVVLAREIDRLSIASPLRLRSEDIPTGSPMEIAVDKKKKSDAIDEALLVAGDKKIYERYKGFSPTAKEDELLVASVNYAERAYKEEVNAVEKTPSAKKPVPVSAQAAGVKNSPAPSALSSESLSVKPATPRNVMSEEEAQAFDSAVSGGLEKAREEILSPIEKLEGTKASRPQSLVFLEQQAAEMLKAIDDVQVYSAKQPAAQEAGVKNSPSTSTSALDSSEASRSASSVEDEKTPSQETKPAVLEKQPSVKSFIDAFKNLSNVFEDFLGDENNSVVKSSIEEAKAQAKLAKLEQASSSSAPGSPVAQRKSEEIALSEMLLDDTTDSDVLFAQSISDELVSSSSERSSPVAPRKGNEVSQTTLQNLYKQQLQSVEKDSDWFFRVEIKSAKRVLPTYPKKEQAIYLGVKEKDLPEDKDAYNKLVEHKATTWVQNRAEGNEKEIARENRPVADAAGEYHRSNRAKAKYGPPMKTNGRLEYMTYQDAIVKEAADAKKAAAKTAAEAKAAAIEAVTEYTKSQSRMHERSAQAAPKDKEEVDNAPNSAKKADVSKRPAPSGLSRGNNKVDVPALDIDETLAGGEKGQHSKEKPIVSGAVAPKFTRAEQQLWDESYYGRSGESSTKSHPLPQPSTWVSRLKDRHEAVNKVRKGEATRTNEDGTETPVKNTFSNRREAFKTIWREQIEDKRSQRTGPSQTI